MSYMNYNFNNLKTKEAKKTMIKDYEGNKITANQYAKEIILRMLDNLECWEEVEEKSGWFNEDGTTQRMDDLTQKEIEKINEMLLKRINGLENYLGYYPRQHL